MTQDLKYPNIPITFLTKKIVFTGNIYKEILIKNFIELADLVNWKGIMPYFYSLHHIFYKISLEKSISPSNAQTSSILILEIL